MGEHKAPHKRVRCDITVFLSLHFIHTAKFHQWSSSTRSKWTQTNVLLNFSGQIHCYIEDKLTWHATILSLRWQKENQETKTKLVMVNTFIHLIDFITPIVFSARQHICYSALYAIARPSVCLSVTWVDQSKTVEVRITQPSPQSSPWL